MECPICDRVNAEAVLQALQNEGSNGAYRASGLSRGTFFGHLKKHRALPPHGSYPGTFGVKPAPHPHAPLPPPPPPPKVVNLVLKPEDQRREDLIWSLYHDAMALSKSATKEDQNKIMALKLARAFVLDVFSLRDAAAKPEDEVKNDAEVRQSLMDKLEAYLPPDTDPDPDPTIPEDMSPQAVMVAPGASAPDAGIVH